MKDNLISSLASAINEAQSCANKFIDTNDGGSCNLDTVILDFTGWRKQYIDKLISLTGIDIGERMKGIYSGYRFVFFQTSGQAACRTKMMEAAKERLSELGYECTMWYHMD